MALSLKATRKAAQILFCVFLVLTHSKLIIRAQQVTLNGTSGTSAELAASLSRAFAGMSLDLDTLAANSTAGLDVNAPNLAKLLNMTLPAGVNLQDALKTVVEQQQSLGGLSRLEDAAKAVANFLNLPMTVGSGTNIEAFLKEVERYKDITDTVRTALNIDQLEQIQGYLSTATSLALSALSAFPLAQLAYLTALIALGAAITSLIAGIFYAVGSALSIAAAVPAVAALDDNGATGDMRADPWFTNLKSRALKLQEPILRFAFSENSVYALQTADSVLGLTESGLKQLASLGSL